MYAPEVVNLIPQLMRHHVERADVQIAAANFLMSLSAQGEMIRGQIL